MSVLSSELRNQLARVVVAAREAAETGARSALQALAVHHYEPYSPMTPEQRRLRNRLRAHGRQLGDKRNPKDGTQEIDLLVRECAYQHWHRMLFARFLAENNLLIEPNSGVAITMSECEELAREQREDPWMMASRFAQRMLPQIFLMDDPVLEVTLPPETRQTLERLLAELPSDVFTAEDSLGWTYQFWQSAEKERVNNSGEKITDRTLPAVTQLFTEHYMVLFLLHNTIGAWHAGKILANRPELKQSAQNEQELREAVAINGYSFDYLRFVREPVNEKDDNGAKGPWRPAAGTFDGWPRQAKDLKVLDPCCGSGHFLVAAFHLLVRLRMTEEELSLEEAIRAVLAENLFGLELDARCTQIAAFNLALTAWKMVGRVIDLPPLNIACSGLSIGVSKNEWLKLAGEDSSLRYGMEQLYDLFEQAPELGSLIDPRRALPDGNATLFAELSTLLSSVFKSKEVVTSDEQWEIGVAAKGIAKAAEMLVNDYTLIITNVPYLGRGNQSEKLKAFADDYHSEAKQDLATMFVDRCLRFLDKNGSLAVVSLQTWLFLPRYFNFRKRLLSNLTWNVVAKLGSGGFETISGEVVNTAMLVVSNSRPSDKWAISGLDATYSLSVAEKKKILLTGPVKYVNQVNLRRGQYVIRLASSVLKERLGDYARAWQGLVTGDDNRFLCKFWEVNNRSEIWRKIQRPPQTTALYTGREMLVRWENGEGSLHNDSRAHNFPPPSVLGRWGVAIQRMNGLHVTLFTGDIFNDAVAPLIPKDDELLLPIWAFAESDEFVSAVRLVNQKVNVTPGAFAEVEFDLEKYKKIAKERYPEGLPEPQSNDPTQWLFHGHPVKAEAHTVLQVAVARLLGYHWPAEQDPDMNLAAEVREWVKRCHELSQFADKDGIVCLYPVRGESSAADRLRHLLAAAFGNDWSTAKEKQLLQAAAPNGRPPSSLEEWLQDKFFEEHCKLFHHRPFIWHIWDGRKDGFNALVNYHRLAGPNGDGRRTLEALTYTYLGDWIERQKVEQREGKEGADARLAAALDLQEQLKKILEGEPPYDIFVRWKPLHEQPIGWEPDINDGVRINIRPFMSATLKKGGRAGAGILRWKPNINWKKDRGKEPESLRPRDDFPWFWGCDPERHPEHRTNFMGGQNFDGNRWNDLHYSNAVKHAARERAAEGVKS